MSRDMIDIEALLSVSVAQLLAEQKIRDGQYWFAGEFEMCARCPAPIADYNFLSGYALLHLTRARALLGAAAFDDLERLVTRGLGLPRRYRGPSGALNWYSGRGTGDHVPGGFDWGLRPVLSIHDDLDDTAIARFLTLLEPRFACAADPALFPVLTERTLLRESSKRRLKAARIERDVYLSWLLPECTATPQSIEERIAVPWENSVELVTVAHIAAALGEEGNAVAQRASGTFVNRLLRAGLSALLQGDAVPLAVASRYYPRVPFAPVAYALRAHALCGGALLTKDTLALVENAVASVPPETRIASDAFTARLYHLWALAGLVHAGAVDLAAKAPSLVALLGQKVRAGIWPDTIFFHEAHIGDYSGRNHTSAVACEALALLIAAGVAT